MKIAEFNDYNKEYGQPELQKLLIKPYEFDIEKDSYFNGDEYHTAEEYSIIFREIAAWCNENQGWVIDDWNNHYTARLTTEMEKLRYDALSEEEKKEKDKENHNRTILNQINEIKKLMADNDYKQMKYLRGEYTDKEWEVIKSWFQTKALEIKQLENQLW